MPHIKLEKYLQKECILLASLLSLIMLSLAFLMNPWAWSSYLLTLSILECFVIISGIILSGHNVDMCHQYLGFHFGLKPEEIGYDHFKKSFSAYVCGNLATWFFLFLLFRFSWIELPAKFWVLLTAGIILFAAYLRQIKKTHIHLNTCCGQKKK
jgi:hypothetical protein